MYEIIIPSYKRAGKVHTFDFFGEVSKIAIPESQEKDYLKYYPKENLIVIPDDRDGNIAKKRNAILDYVDCENILMVDDDFKHFLDIENQKKMNKEDVIKLIEQGFIFLNDSKANLFGFNVSAQRIRVRPFQPFSMTKPFWQMFGVKKTDLRFDEDLKRGEDVDFWLQHLKRDRMVWRFNLYMPIMATKQKTQTGGIEGKTESKKDIDILVKKWGNKIISVNKDNDIVGVHSPINGL